MVEETFEKLYKILNKEQKEAVDTIDGPVMVVAGPGTGKTQILTLRIANILRETDTNPENILALTFTESAAYAMRKRLVEIIGSSAYRIEISTFHGFCNDIIKRFPEDFPRIIGGKNITEVDQIRIIEDIIENSKLKELKPYGDKFYYLRPIISALGSLKRENISTYEFAKILKKSERNLSPALERQVKKNKELLAVYKSYEKELTKNRLYDYDDMIMEVFRVLSKNKQQNKNLLASLQEEFQYILVDEHQDTNNAQNKVLELLCKFHENPNIFIVGDEKQAIFRFQGASLENFLHFKRLYKGAKLITLERNYRSTQNILDSAHSLISKSVEGASEFRKNLKAVSLEEKKKINVYAFAKPESEYEFLAHDIKLKIQSGIAPHEIAVLYRENADALEIARVFDKHGLNYVIESDEDLLSDINLNKLMLIFKAINSVGDKASFIEMAHIDFLGIDPLDLYRLIKSDEKSEKVVALHKKVAGWYKTEKNKNLVEFFEIVVRESGYLDYILSCDSSAEDLEKLNSFFDKTKQLIESHRSARLKDLMQYLDLLREHGIAIRRDVRGAKSEKVRLMTAHRSKGLEFDYVYIINAYDGHWGNKKRPNPLKLVTNIEMSKEADPLADERRLFYVALTRARIGVDITYALEGSGGRERGMRLPSQFIEEIDKNLIDFKDTSSYDKKFGDRRSQFRESKKIKTPVKDKAYLNALFIDHGLSVTALNNYLECPWRYFYNNLVRIPTALTNSLMYGTALHDTLKHFFDIYKSSPNGAPKKLMMELLDKNFKRQPFSEKDFEVFLARGKKSLSDYYDFYSRFWSRDIINEFNIKGILLGEGIKINGKIDKLEILNPESASDRGASEVVVYDYKTSKPKSRNDIEGKTRSSDGNYKRQLVFYNLLLNRYADSKYKMMKGVIDFTEPDDKGRYKREAFEITPAEIAELTELIKKVWKEILNLEFWNKRCGEKKCEYCKLRQLMK